jgi:hypothetical protein
VASVADAGTGDGDATRAGIEGWDRYWLVET